MEPEACLGFFMDIDYATIKTPSESVIILSRDRKQEVNQKVFGLKICVFFIKLSHTKIQSQGSSEVQTN